MRFFHILVKFCWTSGVKYDIIIHVNKNICVLERGRSAGGSPQGVSYSPVDSSILVMGAALIEG